jgi:WD40 repeat protein
LVPSKSAASKLRQSQIYSLAFSPDGATVLSGGDSVVVWNVASGTVVRTLDFGSPSAIALSRDGARVLTADLKRDTAKLWDLATGKLLLDIERHTGRIDSAAFSPDGNRVVLGVVDPKNTSPFCSVQLWNLTTDRLQLTWLGSSLGQTAALGIVAFSRDGAQVLTAGSPTTFWDAVSGKRLRDLKSDLQYIKSLVLSPDGSRVLLGGSGNTDKGAELYDAATTKLVLTFSSGKAGDEVSSAAISNDGSRILTASLNGKLWDAANGQLLQTFTGHKYRLDVVAFSPDSTRALTISDDSAKLWDAASGELLWTFNTPQETYYAPVFTLDGNDVLLVAHGDVTVLNAANGKLVRKFGLRGRAERANESLSLSGISAAVLSPDGKRLLTGDAEGPARLWDIASGQLLATFIGALNGEWIAYTPEGFFDASANGADLILVYQRGKWIPMDRAYTALHRPDLLQAKIAGDPDGKVKASAAALTLH